MNVEELIDWLAGHLARARGLERGAVDVRERFTRYGLDSMAATRMVAELGKVLGRALPPTLPWEHPTIEALARHLTREGGSEPAARPDERRAAARRSEPIAVVGMACRLPSAPDVGAYWSLLCDGVDAIAEVPKERWDLDALFDADPSVPGKLSTRWGGFLEHVDRFDPRFFGISPREGAQIDPQQRLVLELAWEGLEDAGIPPSSLKDSRTGVFCGAMWSDYARVSADPLGSIVSHTATGQDLSIVPARVSYSLGLRGPSVAINTACSSSLVAIHYARRSLELGECDLALAGGVSLMLSPWSTVAMSKFGAMAPDGRSKAFDSRANGYVRGEGGGLVVLKPLSRALADGDRIYCLVRGSAINNDGFSNGLTAPSPKAQELVLRDAYADAGVDVRDVHYVETHGTGTMLGDPIEAGAIGMVLGDGRAPDDPLLLGAVKTNIGHLEAAAGVAGFIKTALVLFRGVVPPNLHFREPNPHIPFEALRLAVPTALEPWPEHKSPRLAGVSGFGFGGTNCHVVLEGAVARPRLATRVRSATAPASEPAARGPVLVFGGQGSQWLRMGVELLHEPAFRAALERCDAAMRPHEQSLFDTLLSEQGDWLEDTARTQPAIFAVQVALAALLRSLGVEPAAVIGQSMGEVAAAHVAGRLSLDDAARVICVRSRLVGRVSGRGAMAVVDQPLAATQAALAAWSGRLSIAVNTSPRSTVVSGDAAALDELLAALEREGVSCRRINVDYASHSPEMDPLLPDLRAELEGVRALHGSVPFYSTVTGDRLDGPCLDADYWCRNLREPVLFAQTVAVLIEHGHDAFIELDPHPVLARSLEECLAERGVTGCVVPAMRRDEPAAEVLAEALSRVGWAGAPAATACVVLPLSAHEPAALRARAEGLAAVLRSRPEPSLADVLHTTGARRSHLPHRLVAVGRDRDELAAALEAHARGQASPAVLVGRAPLDAPRLVFVFPGQGSQWLGMGRALLREQPAFREAILACDAVIAREAGFSVLAELAADEERSRLAEIDVVQPLIFAMQVGLAALWRAWGVEPDALVGHSMGEIAAAHVAGALSLDDAARVICRRSRLLRTVSGRGAMALVELDMVEASAQIAQFADRLSVAVSNGPRSTVIAGDPAALEAVLAELQRREVFCRRINVDVASHSPQMDALLPELRAVLSEVAPGRASLPMCSTVTGERVRGDELTAEYWVSNLRQPVLFSRVTQALVEQGHALFVEISPHPILLPSVEENLAACGVEGATAASLRRGEDEGRTLLASFGRLFVHGLAVDFRRLQPDGGAPVELPSYPWQRERCWLDERARTPRAVRGAEHPLLGVAVSSAAHPDERAWEQRLDVDDLPYLADHRVLGSVVFPAAGYLEMALAAAARALGTSEPSLADVSFEQLLTLEAGSARVAQLVLAERGSQARSFQIASRSEGSTIWTRHVGGTLLRRCDEAGLAPLPEPPAAMARRRGPAAPAAEHQQRMRGRRLEYGPAFQGLVEAWVADGEVIGRVQLPEAVASEGYVVHPALLDACLQVALELVADDEVETYVPVGVGRLHLRQRPARQVWVVAQRRADDGVRADELACDVRIVDDAGASLLEVADLRLRRVTSRARTEGDALDGCLHAVAWRRVPPLPAAPTPGRGTWIVLMDRSGLGTRLGARLVEQGGRCVRVIASSAYERLEPDLFRIDAAAPGDHARLLREALGEDEPCVGVVHMPGVDDTPDAPLDAATLEQELLRATTSAACLVQAIVRHGFRDPPRLALVTRGGQRVLGDDAVSIHQAALHGLGRALALEHPELRCTRIDLEAGPARDQEPELLLCELQSTERAEQVALRGGERHVARIVLHADDAADSAEASPLEPANGRPFQLEIRRPGVLDRIVPREQPPLPLGADEVLIEVVMAGLNFRDVLLALGVLPSDAPQGDASGPSLGRECAGIVVAVGEAVGDLAPGQEVVALGAGMFGTLARAKAALCVPRPASLPWEQAAALPIVLTTAVQALEHVARLRAGERVLVHAGAGGVGLAAIQWAMHVGAEVLATAGSEDKRAYLRELGVRHVFDSRSLGFVEEVRRATQGEGVDVVLNSLSGEFIPASLSVLRDHGRFVEIGQRDYHEDKPLGLRPFLRNLSLSLVDLLGLMATRPAHVQALLRQALALVEDGTLRPLPVTVFPVSRAGEAFQYMAQAKHVGKVVLSLRDPEVRIVPLRARGSVEIRDDRSYLVTGGLGGLGLEVSRWLVQRGARHLVLVGRRGPGEDAERVVRALVEAGVRVEVVRADVSQRAALASGLATIDPPMPPLGGIVHAAGLLDDRTLLELDAESLRRVLGPKAIGAWNLHELSQGSPLDFFVMYSSAAALFGSPGQGNYCAANAVLDALAHARERQGLPAMSIQWGPFSDVGLAAAQDNRGNRMSHRGFASLTPAEGLAALEQLLRRPRAEVGVARFDLRRWVEFYPAARQLPLFAELGERTADAREDEGAAQLRRTLAAADPDERRALLEAHVIEQAAAVLRIDARRIERAVPLKTFGIDSLMSLELRNRLEAGLGLRLSATILFTYPDVAALARRLSELLAQAADASDAPRLDPPGSTTESASPPAHDERALDIDALSSHELLGALARELEDE